MRPWCGFFVLLAVSSGETMMAWAADPVSDILKRLEACNYEERGQGVEELKKLASEGISESVGARLLRAAARVPRCPDLVMPDEASEALMSAVLESPRPTYVPIIEENFEAYSGRARKLAVAILAEEPTGIVGVRALGRILRQHASDPELDLFPRTQSALSANQNAAALGLAELLPSLVSTDLRYSVQIVLLDHVRQGWLSADQQRTLAKDLEAIISPLMKSAELEQKPSGIDWMWTDEYQTLRDNLVISLDLLGSLAPFSHDDVFRRALTLSDPKLKHSAVVAMLRAGLPVEQAQIDIVARSAEMRIHLHQALKEMGKLDLMPEKFATQASLAEGDLVNWLVYPTELNRVPDEIELMKEITVPDDTSNRNLQVYLFRFRTFPPHWAASDGWMAGLAGPYDPDEPPQSHGGATFSEFKKWDELSPDEHVSEILDLSARQSNDLNGSDSAR